MDKRPCELEATRSLLEFLCSNYPKLLGMEEYTHPIKGVCTLVIIRPYSSVRVDIDNILWVKFDIHDNILSILTEAPGVLYNMNHFIVDETVM